ncbi:hypothetical protein, partial [Frankia sp. CiP1_Cm_nod2]
SSGDRRCHESRIRRRSRGNPARSYICLLIGTTFGTDGHEDEAGTTRRADDRISHPSSLTKMRVSAPPEPFRGV